MAVAPGGSFWTGRVTHELEHSGLAFDHWVDRGRGWLAALPLP